MFEIWLTGVSGVPFKLPGLLAEDDANRAVNRWNTFEGVTAEARPVVD